MDASYILTGYNNTSLSLVNLPTANDNTSLSLVTFPTANDITMLLDKFVDISQCHYSDDEATVFGLEGSKLLAQLPWNTPWADLFKPVGQVEVFSINWLSNIWLSAW